MATTNDLKNGMTLNLDGQLWTVVEFQHVKPGKGGAFVRTKLKNVLSGKVVERTFNAGVKVDVASVDRREMQFLYREGDDFVFMDTQDYEQPRMPASVVGDAADYLLGEQTVTVAFNEGVPLYVDLPAAVELTISRPTRASRATGPRRDQAGHARDRRDDPGAAVHLDGGEDQGRHQDRPVPRPRLMSAACPPCRWHHASTCRKARKRALDILFEAELRRRTRPRPARRARGAGQPTGIRVRRDLVRGVAAHAARIDELIAAHAEGWTLDRMPTVDRNVLRIGVYELFWAPDVPDGVAISEAVVLAGDLSTEASPTFVNGLLARLLELKPTLQV